MSKMTDQAADDPVEFLRNLSVDALESQRAELAKKLAAVDVLLKAAITLRDGITVGPKPGRKPLRKSQEDASSANDQTPEVPAGLKLKVLAALRQYGSMRIKTLIEQVGENQEVVEHLLRNDAAFECRGPGYWTLN